MDESEQVIGSPDELEPIADEMLRRHIGAGLSASDLEKMNLEVQEHTKEPYSDPPDGNTVPKEGTTESKGGRKANRKDSDTTGKVKKTHQGLAEAQTQDSPPIRVHNSLYLQKT